MLFLGLYLILWIYASSLVWLKCINVTFSKLKCFNLFFDSFIMYFDHIHSPSFSLLSPLPMPSENIFFQQFTPFHAFQTFTKYLHQAAVLLCLRYELNLEWTFLLSDFKGSLESPIGTLLGLVLAFIV